MLLESEDYLVNVVPDGEEAVERVRGQDYGVALVAEVNNVYMSEEAVDTRAGRLPVTDGTTAVGTHARFGLCWSTIWRW